MTHRLLHAPLALLLGLAAAPAHAASPAWDAGIGRDPWPQPVVARDRVFVASGGTIAALRTSDGSRVWSHLSCSGIGTVAPALADGALVVGDAGGDLAAYDPTDGAQRWCDDLGGSITSAVTAADGVAFVTNGVDAVAIDVATGVQLWRYTAPDFAPITSSAAVADGLVVVAGGDRVYGLDEATGALRWARDLGPQARLSTPAIADGLVYLGGDALYALDAADGALAWRASDVGTNVSTPAVAGGLVVVGAQDPAFGLHAFDAATGGLAWSSQATGESMAGPTIAGHVVWTPAESGELLAFDLASGRLLGRLADPAGLPFAWDGDARVAVADGAVYAITDAPGGDRLDAFRAP